MSSPTHHRHAARQPVDLTGAAWVAFSVVPAFPDPPPWVGQLLAALSQPASQLMGERPWDPPTLAPAQQHEMWCWLDQVVVYLNAVYGWSPAAVVPPCWPLHPNLVAELPVLALSRVERFGGPTSTYAAEWHDRLLPGFHARMNAALGAAAADCRSGVHTPAPASLGAAVWSQTSDMVWSPPRPRPVPAEQQEAAS